MSEGDELIRIRISLGIGLVNTVRVTHRYVARSSWEARTYAEQQEYLDKAARDYVDEHVHCLARAVEE